MLASESDRKEEPAANEQSPAFRREEERPSYRIASGPTMWVMSSCFNGASAAAKTLHFGVYPDNGDPTVGVAVLFTGFDDVTRNVDREQLQIRGFFLNPTILLGREYPQGKKPYVECGYNMKSRTGYLRVLGHVKWDEESVRP